jgi:hypothetical protein
MAHLPLITIKQLFSFQPHHFNPIATQMASHLSPRLKRDRSLFTDATAPAIPIPAANNKHHKTKPTPDMSEMAAPLQDHEIGETKQTYFSRLARKIQKHLFSATNIFDKDGIYIYKRPVRSSNPQHAALLAQSGTVFHHVVVYVKLPGKDLVALEFNPSNGMDVTQSLIDEAPAAPVLKTPPELPAPEHLPMLYCNVDHHSLDTEHVQRALAFANSKTYQVLTNNCIAFADFICRCLTGNKIKNAPLIFDALVGNVPKVDSPLLPLIYLMTQMTWFHVADGSRLMQEFLEKHGSHVIVPVKSSPSATTARNTGKEEEKEREADTKAVMRSKSGECSSASSEKSSF